METAIESIVKNVPNCSRIIDADRAIYQEFFKTDRKKYPYHYARSWVFIDQISNGVGIKYFDKQKEHLITIAPNWGSSTPNYIYLPLGRDAIRSVPPLVEQLSKLLEQKITIKKIYGEENRDFLFKYGCTEVPQTGNLDFLNLDDEKYPEVVCDVEQIIKATIGFPTEVTMEHFKNHIKPMKKKIFLWENHPDERNLTKELDKDFRKLVEKWSTETAERTAKQFKKNADVERIKGWMSGVYYPYFLQNIDKLNAEGCMAYLTFLDEKPAAFTAAYPLNETCLAVNASFCDVSYPGLIQYQFFRLAVRAKVLGFQYLNLGSNDTESQYKYKSSMGKVDEVYPYILEYK